MRGTITFRKCCKCNFMMNSVYNEASVRPGGHCYNKVLLCRKEMLDKQFATPRSFMFITARAERCAGIQCGDESRFTSQ